MGQGCCSTAVAVKKSQIAPKQVFLNVVPDENQEEPIELAQK